LPAESGGWVFRSGGAAQPERDVRRLHCLLHRGLQLFAQLVQVHLLAKRCTEGCHDLGAVILAAIEAPINNALNALAQGLEQGAGRPAPCSLSALHYG